ncbi:MAG: helix-hairpin-helix domain-containing protein [Desulfurococcales archaeon]|nr:helix-hairpin-helix domain-containing protein [Desulfurococcales archaeon]
MKKQEVRPSIVVYADYREERSGVPRLIEEEGVPVVRKNLPMGDYVVSDNIVVERKTAWDFAKSLFDGRLFDQARRMREEYETVIFIVEGDPLRLRRYRNMQKQLYAAMVTLLVDYDSKIIYSGSPRESAYIIASIARRLAKTERYAILARKKGRIETVTDWQYYILQSFPGIGAKTARRIAERFKSLREFCNASLSEIASIEGVGEKKAELIFTILNRRFDNYTGRRKRATLEDFYKDTGSGE